MFKRYKTRKRNFILFFMAVYFFSPFNIRSEVSTSSLFKNDVIFCCFFFVVFFFFPFGFLSPVVVSDFHQPCRRILIVHGVYLLFFFFFLCFVSFVCFVFFFGVSFHFNRGPVCLRVETERTRFETDWWLGCCVMETKNERKKEKDGDDDDDKRE